MTVVIVLCILAGIAGHNRGMDKQLIEKQQQKIEELQKDVEVVEVTQHDGK